MELSFLKGVGPKKLRLLEQLGIHSSEELIQHFPRRYEDRTCLLPLAQLQDGTTAALTAEIVSVEERRPRPRLSILKAVIRDESGFGTATWFNQAFLKPKLVQGTKLLLSGRVRRTFGKVEILVQDYELFSGLPGEAEGQILPVYPLVAGLNQKFFRQVIGQLLDAGYEEKEYYPAAFRKQYALTTRKDALFRIHRPKTWQDLEIARRRLIFDEFFLLQLSLGFLRKKGNSQPGILHHYTGALIEPWEKSLPFAFTQAQKRVIAQIRADMTGPKGMSRLIQGDVGSGKTAVAAWALLLAVESGCQGALMAPTEILAQQHYENLQNWFVPLGLKIGFFKGSQSAGVRREQLAALAAGEIHIAVGTHALFQEQVTFQRLSLIVIDEQHRFGVRQRALLQEKGQNPDLLVMSATPIPRTLALTLYGDLDISVIDELPPGRKPVKTICILEKAREKLNQLLLSELRKGHQAFVVCPLIQESEVLDLQNAIQIYENLKKRLLPYPVGLLHGKQSPAEKEEMMEDFAAGRLKLLVSTTVVEVGVNVPEATVMVVENSDRFGLAQLHQLRGRVGRGKDQAYCILVTNSQEPLALARLKLMTETADGFRLAEEDMLLRGPGEFFGTRQHGLPEFRLARLPEDKELLEQARQAALDLLKEDPTLQSPEWTELKAFILQKMEDRIKS